jgi:hypothetical protein
MMLRIASSHTARVALCALAFLAPLPLAAQGKPESGAFIVRLGKDTMVVEKFVRTADRLESWSVNRQPATIRRHYVVTFDKGVPVKMEYDGGRADGSQPLTKVTMQFGADTTTVAVTRNDSTQTMRVPAKGVVPTVGNSFALTELAVARFLAAKADSVAVPTLPLGGRAMQPLAIKRVGKNVVHVDYFGAPWVTTLDAQGRIVAVDGAQSASKILVERVADVDVEGLTKAFAARDAQGKGFGVASPADSVRATFGEARLAIDYSRPAQRGRQLIGNLIPLDTVWRTGANAATMFTTSATLDIGGTTVPAGTYTLWTRPTSAGWQLVINRQTKQWGTEYDSKQDFARIPMTVNKASAKGPEHFLIAIEPKDATSGLLRMTWGDVDVSVPVAVKTQSAAK